MGAAPRKRANIIPTLTIIYACFLPENRAANLTFSHLFATCREKCWVCYGVLACGSGILVCRGQEADGKDIYSAYMRVDSMLPSSKLKRGKTIKRIREDKKVEMSMKRSI
jgi:hypothetical protein